MSADTIPAVPQQISIICGECRLETLVATGGGGRFTAPVVRLAGGAGRPGRGAGGRASASGFRLAGGAGRFALGAGGNAINSILRLAGGAGRFARGAGGNTSLFSQVVNSALHSLP